MAERCERRETENTEVGGSANHRQRHARHNRILATEHFRTSGDDRAANALARDVFDREVNRISKTEERNERGGDEQPHLPPNSFWITTRNLSAGKDSNGTS